MEEQFTAAADEPRRNPIWKLIFYILGLFVFGRVMVVIFSMLEGNPALERLAKVQQVVTQSLDVTHDMDAVIVTVWSLLLTLLFVLPVGWVYMYTKAKEGYDRTLVQTLIVMGMVVCGMMMLIQDQFSRALALVGVVSAVRFRTNLRDPKDAVYMLIAIGIGMGAGLQVYRVAGWLMIVMCFVFLAISKLKLGEQPAGTEPPVVKDKKDKKDKKEKKEKKEKPFGLEEGLVSLISQSAMAQTAVPPDRLERIADSLRDMDRGIKRPNTAILIEAMDAEAAMGYVTNALARFKAPWHLVTFAPAEGTTRLEYMVRLEGEGDLLGDVRKTIEGSCGTTVRTVEVRFVPGGATEQSIASAAS